MSDTPRTDIRAFMGSLNAGEVVVSVDFARELENELGDKDRQLAESRAETERLKKNLRLLLCKKHLDECENGLFNSRFPDDEPCLICVAEAADGGEG